MGKAGEAFGQQRAIGRKYWNKTFLESYIYKGGEKLMQHRFAHQVKVQKLDLPPQPVGQKVELVERHLTLRTGVLRTEDTAEVADIGYFQIGAIDHENEKLKMKN